MARAKPKSLPTRTIRQTVTLPAPPKAVYELLMTTRGHRGFTGADARVSPKVGGTFEAWDGYIHGRNLELVPGKRIVQAWRPTEEDWPVEHDSIVRIGLTPVARGTRLQFTHTQVLRQHAGHLSEDWKDHYWTPLRAYLQAHPPASKRPTARARSRRRA